MTGPELDANIDGGGGSPPTMPGIPLTDVLAFVTEFNTNVRIFGIAAVLVVEAARSIQSMQDMPLRLNSAESNIHRIWWQIRALHDRVGALDSTSNADNLNFQGQADMGYSSDRPQISPVIGE